MGEPKKSPLREKLGVMLRELEVIVSNYHSSFAAHRREGDANLFTQWVATRERLFDALSDITAENERLRARLSGDGTPPTDGERSHVMEAAEAVLSDHAETFSRLAADDTLMDAQSTVERLSQLLNQARQEVLRGRAEPGEGERREIKEAVREALIVWRRHAEDSEEYEAIVNLERAALRDGGQPDGGRLTEQEGE